MSFDELIDLLDRETRLSKIGREMKFENAFGANEGEKHAWATGKLAGGLEVANKIREICRKALESA